MTTDLATTGLTEQEQQFLYNMEVLGLNQQRSADLAGLGSYSHVLKKPDFLAAREKIRATVRSRVDITKEDVLRGIQSAIQQADILADPMAQIVGWREISKMLGYDAPKQINIVVSGDVKNVRRQISQLNDSDLVEMLGADNVIDAAFYPVEKAGDSG